MDGNQQYFDDSEIVVCDDIEVWAEGEEEEEGDEEEVTDDDEDGEYDGNNNNYYENDPIERVLQQRKKKLKVVERDGPGFNFTKEYILVERFKTFEHRRIPGQLILERGFCGVRDKKIKQTESAVLCMCKSKMEVNQKVYELSCGHQYHVDCLLDWLDTHSTCPEEKCQREISWLFSKEPKPTSDNKYTALHKPGINDSLPEYKWVLYGLKYFLIKENETEAQCVLHEVEGGLLECTLCRDLIEMNQRIAKTRGCKHFFHASCMKDYLKFCCRCHKCNESLITRETDEEADEEESEDHSSSDEELESATSLELPPDDNGTKDETQLQFEMKEKSELESGIEENAELESRMEENSELESEDEIQKETNYKESKYQHKTEIEDDNDEEMMTNEHVCHEVWKISNMDEHGNFL